MNRYRYIHDTNQKKLILLILHSSLRCLIVSVFEFLICSLPTISIILLSETLGCLTFYNPKSSAHLNKF